MIKTLKFDFFQVLMPVDAKNSFEAVVKKIEGLEGTDRVYDNGDYPVRLQEVTPFENFFVCDIARIRMNDIPDKMKLSGETEELDLDDDEGLGEVTSFLYNPKLHVLVLMRNRNAVSIAAVSNYIENKGLLYGVQYLPIMHEDAYKRLASLDLIQRLDLQVASPGNGTIFKDLGLTDSELTDLYGQVPRVRITCSLSMGHIKESLPKKKMLDFIKKVLTRQKEVDATGESVNLVVSGREKNFEKEVIDLFEDALTDQFDVNIKNQRKITDIQRRHAITSIWMKHQASVQKVLSKSEE